jgi:hypothetical protein
MCAGARRSVVVTTLLGVREGNNAGSRKLPRQFWPGLVLPNIVDVSWRRRAEMVADFHAAGWAPGRFWRSTGLRGRRGPSRLRRGALGGQADGGTPVGARSDERGDRAPFLVSKRYTLILNEKGNLRPMLEAWRGRKFAPQELKGFDLERLLGSAASSSSCTC